jgi:D-alanyl-D-alanine carboxypeptidase
MINAKHSGPTLIILVMAVSLAFEATACAATLELNCSKPANLHLSVDLSKGTVLYQTKMIRSSMVPGPGIEAYGSR